MTQYRNKLARRRHAPAARKAREEYIFQGKAFCGYCSASMVGTGGTGKAGKVYHYFSCGEDYKNHTCTKKRENKEFLEQLITEMTLNYVLEPERMNYIADRRYGAYHDEFNEKKLRSLERRIDVLDEEIEKAVTAFIDGDSNIRKP